MPCTQPASCAEIRRPASLGSARSHHFGNVGEDVVPRIAGKATSKAMSCILGCLILCSTTPYLRLYSNLASSNRSFVPLSALGYAQTCCFQTCICTASETHFVLAKSLQIMIKYLLSTIAVHQWFLASSSFTASCPLASLNMALPSPLRVWRL
jgi:hypothetical protein